MQYPWRLAVPEIFDGLSFRMYYLKINNKCPGHQSSNQELLPEGSVGLSAGGIQCDSIHGAPYRGGLDPEQRQWAL